MKETILHKDANLFLMELTDIELGLKRLAHRARVRFVYTKLQDRQMMVTWTYAFDQKNFLTKPMLASFLKQKHQYWMAGFLAEMKRQVENIYQSESTSPQTLP